MSQRFSFGNMEVNLSSTGRATSGRPDPETPFRVLVVGDFSGRANRGVCERFGRAAPRRPLIFDCDSLEQVMEKLSPRIELALEQRNDCQITLEFSEMEDFHPDRIYERLELFKALRKTRKQLLDPSTFAAAAQEVQSWATVVASPDTMTTHSSETAKQADADAEEGDMFTRLLGQPKTHSSSQAAASVESMIKQIVGPHIVPDPDPRQDRLIAAVDAATSNQMRAILHHPEFQRLEAAWRSLDFLVRNIETDELLKLYVLDLTKSELAADLTSSDNLKSSGLYDLLIEQTINTPGGVPWALMVMDAAYDATVQDMEVLGRLAKISCEAKVGCVASATTTWLGCRSLIETPSPIDWTQPIDPDAQAAWLELREMDEAIHLGLTLPGFLLRLPYGSQTESVDRFDFEELDMGAFDAVKDHNAYLWGHSSILCGLALCRGFTVQGWGFTPGGANIDGLPTHIFKHDGESEMTPIAEAWLTDRSADAIMDKGLMPVLSVKNRDAVQLTRVQSIAQPPKNLAGPWG